MSNIIEGFGQNCHTTQRHDIYRCYQREALTRLRAASSSNNTAQLSQIKLNLFKLNTFIVDHWEQNHLNLIQDNDPCTKSHSAVAQYWQAKAALDHFQTASPKNQ